VGLSRLLLPRQSKYRKAYLLTHYLAIVKRIGDEFTLK